MQFEKGYIYHIYNQGNNRQKIFFERENYLFFLKKIQKHIIPYADILAWCLMPNHFHLMVLVNETTVGVAPSDADGIKQRTINDSIGIICFVHIPMQLINKKKVQANSLEKKQNIFYKKCNGHFLYSFTFDLLGF